MLWASIFHSGVGADIVNKILIHFSLIKDLQCQCMPALYLKWTTNTFIILPSQGWL